MSNYDIKGSTKLGGAYSAQYIPWKDRFDVSKYSPSYGYYDSASRSRKSGQSSGSDSKGWRPMTLYSRGGYHSSWSGFNVLIQGPYSGQALISGVFDCDRANPADYTTYFGPYCSGVTTTPDPNLAARVVTEMLLKLQNRDIDIGTALGEGRETLSMIATRGLQLWEAYRHLRRGDLYRTMKSLGMGGARRKRLSPDGVWLETWFGWVPLFQDIYGAADAFKKGLKREHQTVRVVRRLKTTDTSVKNGWSAESSQQVTGTAYYRIDNSTLANLSALGLINPLAIAWELVPYSFVVDWLFPVGNFLQASTADVGMVFLDGCLATHTRVKSERTKRDPIYSYGEMRGQATANAYQRTPFVTPPRAQLYMKSPFSTFHILHAAALLLSGHKRRH